MCVQENIPAVCLVGVWLVFAQWAGGVVCVNGTVFVFIIKIRSLQVYLDTLIPGIVR